MGLFGSYFEKSLWLCLLYNLCKRFLVLISLGLSSKHQCNNYWIQLYFFHPSLFSISISEINLIAEKTASVQSVKFVCHNRWNVVFKSMKYTGFQIRQCAKSLQKINKKLNDRLRAHAITISVKSNSFALRHSSSFGCEWSDAWLTSPATANSQCTMTFN